MTQTCIHHHIHKCGGTTIEALLAHISGKSHIHVESRDNSLLLSHEVNPLLASNISEESPYATLSSHTLKVPICNADTYANIHLTVIRNPVHRLFSAYQHIKRYQYGPPVADLIEFLQLPYNSNFQCRYLFENEERRYPAVYEYLQTVLFDSQRSSHSRLLCQAKQEISKFADLISVETSRSRFYVIEFIDLLYYEMATRLSIEPSAFPAPSQHLNRSASGDSCAPNPDISSYIVRSNRLDLHLYRCIRSANRSTRSSQERELALFLSATNHSHEITPYEWSNQVIFLR